jgi:hypothetical protein
MHLKMPAEAAGKIYQRQIYQRQDKNNEPTCRRAAGARPGANPGKPNKAKRGGASIGSIATNKKSTKQNLNADTIKNESRWQGNNAAHELNNPI